MRGEVAPLVDEHPVDLKSRGHRGPERDEVAAAAGERRVGGEVEDLALRGLALERDGPVGCGERARRAGRAGERRGRGVRQDAGVGRTRLDEVERAPAPERAGEGPRRDGAVLGAQRRHPLVLAEHLGGGYPGDPRPVRGEPREAVRRERSGEAVLDEPREGRRLLRELGQPAERDHGERVVRRADREPDELRGLRRHIRDAARDEGRREPSPGVARGALREHGGEHGGLTGVAPRDEGVDGDAGAAPRPGSAGGGGEEERRERGAAEPAHRASPDAGAGAMRIRRPNARSIPATRSRNAA